MQAAKAPRVASMAAMGLTMLGGKQLPAEAFEGKVLLCVCRRTTTSRTTRD